VEPPGLNFANQSLKNHLTLCDSRAMRAFLVIITMLFVVPALAGTREGPPLYRWVDSEGQVHFGDTIPAEYAEIDKQILNRHGIAVRTLRGKKSDEEIAAERRKEQMARDLEVQRRADRALLSTYMTIEEILMHRDRRVELFQAQTRVTALYLRNIQHRLDGLLSSAQRFQPYNDDPEAPMIDIELTEEIAATRDTITRHEGNLERFKVDELEIIERFERDIDRFRKLKGLNLQTAQTAD